jgi:hypothetical protein
MKHWMLLITLCLAACATAPKPVHIDVPGADKSTDVVVHDLRPGSEKESKTFSVIVTSGGYGIYRQGDATLDPPAIQVFRRSVSEALGPEYMQGPMTIHHLVIYTNLKSELRRNSLFIGLGGAVGGALAATTTQADGVAQSTLSQSMVDTDAFDKVDDEYERAFYSKTENPTHESVFVIYVDATIAGKRVFTKSISAIAVPKGEVAYSLAVKSAIRYWIKQYKAS